MMTSYLAFKGLRVDPDGLRSPRRNTRWTEVYSPALGKLTYGLRTSTLDYDQGVYAATIYEAWRYVDDDECRLFVVAPDADAETEIGTKGWRTTCAYVVSELTSLREVAELIVASHRAGYPQVSEILRWARHMLAPPAATARELVARSVEVRRMLRAAAWGQYSTISHKGLWKEAMVTWSTPVRVVAGDKPPVLVGMPYLSYGSWGHKRYRPSTMRIEVGEEWPLLRSLCS